MAAVPDPSRQNQKFDAHILVGTPITVMDQIHLRMKTSVTGSRTRYPPAGREVYNQSGRTRSLQPIRSEPPDEPVPHEYGRVCQHLLLTYSPLPVRTSTPCNNNGVVVRPDEKCTTDTIQTTRSTGPP
ncbi:hypothetical protein BU23DRAFT_288108 [Bimuria novae-zelandiae CBS 107.79]|uniref:Uncharacterized protein n=1 Tax=Bimuria novae-zelandiae CBS 107.79 TaxID=1447943 RepID=A0A6A5URL0_9PLEO|nr:hypothetical protein BU23DRAFT_288108 [Bimuria novae-zelandiae CBS 107.79]